MSPTDLRHYIRVYDDGLDPAFCRKMIESFSGLKEFHQRNGRGVRAGLERSGWTELNVSRMADQAFLLIFRGRIEAALERYNRDIGLAVPLPNY